MRRILALVLTLALVFGLASFTAIAAPGDAPDRIEISFRVGDSVLNINGEPVEVETPFVAGDGVTLVPLRVITEAFGADVDWIGDTRQVILTYQNVEIVLQIENINVYINEQRQTLLYNPLIVNNVTMVPLRFISENFGAEVGWDGDTQAITVVKELSDGQLHDIEDVLRRSNKAMAGDSFLGWSIRRTPDMELSFRSFDGWRTTFGLDYGVTISVNFSDNTDETTFAILQAREMELARNFTPMGQTTRRTTSGAEFVATQYRNQMSFFERRAFIRPNNRIVAVTIAIPNDIETSERDELLTILDTFDFVFRADETEDLSDVVDGMRLFEDNEFNFSLRIPAQWWEVSDARTVNTFEFEYIDIDGIYAAGLAFEIYTLQQGDSINAWANEWLARGASIFNPETNTFSELRNTRINGRAAVYYNVNVRMVGQNFVSRRIFWEYQGFMYTLFVRVRAGEEAVIQRIFDSVTFEAIDADEIGFLLRDQMDYDHNALVSTVRNTNLGFSVDVPVSWLRFMDSYFVDQRSAVEITIARVMENFTLTDIREEVERMNRQSEVRVVRPAASIPAAELSSGLRGFMYEIKVTPDVPGTEPFYLIEYVINSGNRAYIISVTISESNSTTAARENIARIVRSFVVN